MNHPKPDIKRRGLTTTVDYGPRKKKVTYTRSVKQGPVSVKENGRHSYWLDPRPLKVRIQKALRWYWQRFIYYLKFTLIVGTAAGFAAVFLDISIQKYAVAAYEAYIVEDRQYIL